MQSGSSRTAIVPCLQGMSCVRGSDVTERKKSAHRAHRSRINQELKQMQRDPDLDLDESAYEGLNPWDIW